MFKRISFATLALFAVACGGEAQTAPPPPPVPVASATPPADTQAPPPADTTPPPAPKPSMAEMQKKTVTAFLAAMNARDAAKLAETFAADAKVSAPVAGDMDVITGRDAIVKRFASVFAGFPDTAVGASRIFLSGNTAVMQWVMTGTNTAAMDGAPPTNKKIGVNGASVLTFNADGLIQEERAYMDDGTLASQLGMMPGKPRELATLPTGDAQWIAAAGNDDETKLADKAKNSWPALWQKKDVKAYGDLMTDDCEHIDFGFGTDRKGKKANVGEMEMFIKAFPDVQISVDNAWGVGNVAVMEWTVSGTQKGALGPIRPTGKAAKVHGLDIDEWTGDKMSKGYTYSNSFELLGQLGQLPKPKAAPAAAKAPAPAPKKK